MIPTYSAPDFRTYPAEIVTRADGSRVRMQLCEELVEGRWEPFYSIRPLPEK